MKAPLSKAGSLALTVALALCLAGCSTEKSDPLPTNEQETIQEEAENQAKENTHPTYSVGEAVETDLVKLTLDSASLAIAVDTHLQIGYGASAPIEQSFYSPAEYNPDESSQKVAGKGHTFVCVEFTTENLDRKDKIIGESKYIASVKCGGREYASVYEGSFSSINTEYGLAYNNMSGHFYVLSDKTRSNVVAPQETETMRAVIDIPVEMEDLSSPFEIIFHLPTSTGKAEAFTYAVN